MVYSVWMQPTRVPSAQEYPDIRRETKIFNISSDAFPLDDSLAKAVCDVSCVAKIHPMYEEMKGGRIWYRKEEDRVVRR